MKSFQDRVGDWMLACFGLEITLDVTERNHRFLEESLELVQSLGCTADAAHQLVDYVFKRDKGDAWKEIGDVMLTLHALANAQYAVVDMAADDCIKRAWDNIEGIRLKSSRKPKFSPLPE